MSLLSTPLRETFFPGVIHMMIKLVTFVLIMATLFPAFAFCGDTPPASITGEISDGLLRLKDESFDFAKTPFQVSNNNLFITIGVLGAVGTAFVYDRDMQQKLQSKQSSSLDKMAKIGSLAGDPYIHLGISALVYGAAIAADSPKWKETGEMMAEALILTDAATFLIKEGTGRARPVAGDRKDDFRPFQFKNDYDSFPSMHAASSFALASVVARTSESVPVAILSYTAATFVGFSRMYQNKHWASDILLGAAIGELAGRVVTSYHARKGNDQRLVFMPTVSGTGASMNILYRF